MKESENSVKDLLYEFSNITVDINPKETFGKVDDSGINFWDFILIFNRNFSVDSNNPKDLDQKINLEYNKYITEKKLNAYKEIDDVVVSEDSLLKKKNYINSIKSQIVELLSNYYYHSEDKTSEYFHLLKNNYIKRSIPEQKRVDRFYESELVHPFLIVQKETLENISNYLDEKNNMLDKINITIPEESTKNIIGSFNLSWQKSKIDLIELIIALHETKSIFKDNELMNQIDMITVFSDIFRLDLSDYRNDLSQAKIKRKIRKAPFINRLKIAFENYCSKS
ncbi:MAG: RteC domain-containing protein [Bacteroidales bacterium]|nr:RteC domain-containing protein [Bacteroidales bacterium]